MKTIEKNKLTINKPSYGNPLLSDRVKSPNSCFLKALSSAKVKSALNETERAVSPNISSKSPNATFYHTKTPNSKVQDPSTRSPIRIYHENPNETLFNTDLMNTKSNFKPLKTFNENKEKKFKTKEIFLTKDEKRFPKDRVVNKNEKSYKRNFDFLEVKAGKNEKVANSNKNRNNSCDKIEDKKRNLQNITVLDNTPTLLSTKQVKKIEQFNWQTVPENLKIDTHLLPKEQNASLIPNSQRDKISPNREVYSPLKREFKKKGSISHMKTDRSTEAKQNLNIEEELVPYSDINIEHHKIIDKHDDSNIYQLNQRLITISKLRDILLRQKRQNQESIQTIHQEMKIFTEKIMEIAQIQIQKTLKNINEEFESEISSRSTAILLLDNFSAKFMQIKNMEKFLSTTGHNSKSDLILIRCQEIIKQFDENISSIQNMMKQPLKINSSEKIVAFKKNLKLGIYQMFMGSFFEETAESSRLFDINTLADFETFMKSEDSEDVLKIKPVKEKLNTNIIISFENKDLFDNALVENISKPLETVPLTSLSNNFFAGESSDFSTIGCSETVRTPRLHSELGLDSSGSNKNKRSEEENSIKDLLDDSTIDQRNTIETIILSEESKLQKFENLLNRVHQKQSSRSDYLKTERRASEVDKYEDVTNYIENKIKEEGERATSPKRSLFQAPSPAFKNI